MREISGEMAEYLFRGGEEVYRLYPEEGTEGVVESVDDLQKHASCGGIFGTEHSQWINRKLAIWIIAFLYESVTDEARKDLHEEYGGNSLTDIYLDCNL